MKTKHYTIALFVGLFLFIGVAQAASDTYVLCYYMFPGYHKVYRKPVIRWAFHTNNDGLQKAYTTIGKKNALIIEGKTSGNQLSELTASATIYRVHRGLRPSCNVTGRWLLTNVFEQSKIDEMAKRNKTWCKQFYDSYIKGNSKY